MNRVWNLLGKQSHERERRALSQLAKILPDEAPYRAWANFEFVALDGAVFDVDALVVCRDGVFLIELASWRGAIEFGARTWVQTQQNGQRTALDNPYQLAVRKARLLRSALNATLEGATAPHIEAVVWVTEVDVEPHFVGNGAEHLVFQSDVSPASIEELVRNGAGPAVRKSPWSITADVRDRVTHALQALGLYPSGRSRRWGDWRLTTLRDAGQRHQDWLVEHVSRGDQRLARIYSVPNDIANSELKRLQEAARREYEILRGLRHPNILEVETHLRSERRPGLIFANPANAMRLDHWLEANDVSIDAKLSILVQVAEAVRYAHRKSVVHRAVTPQSVLVVPHEDGPQALLYNWHTSRKDAAETGTAHIHDYMDDISQVYLAPELSRDPAGDEAVDIYGIGAVAFALFAEQPPATSLGDLVEVLMQGKGLRPSRVVDGVPADVDNFIFDATRVNPRQRHGSLTAVIDKLEAIRRGLVARRSAAFDPLEAAPGDQLTERFVVQRRIGVGSTATALLAHDGDSEVVLKVANGSQQNERLKAEAATLRALDHVLIVSLLDTVELGGRHTLVLQYAGASLRDRLRNRNLSLDELRRFGEDLCDILVALERSATLHRDIKPANLGIGTPVGSVQRLMLFDFSLADVSLDAIDVGTPIYRDPFLAMPRRGRWDEYADRYAAALTLYEMVTGQLPQWGDGVDPMFDDTAECNVHSQLFPASVREPLDRFFRRAFARDVRDRFDNAVDARSAWLAAFEETTHTPHASLEEITLDATADTRVATLGLSPVALDALDRLEVISIQDLLSLKPQELQFQKGVSNAIRRELAELRTQLIERFPVEAGLAEASQPVEGDIERYSVDQVLDRLAGGRDSTVQREFTAAVLGGDDVGRALPWPSVDDLAERTESELHSFLERFQQLREKWERKRVLGPLRDDIARIVDNNDGALSDVDLAQRVLGLRGSTLSDDGARIATSAAVCRAAFEAEDAAHEPRFSLRRLVTGAVFIVSRPELGDALQPLGMRTRQLVHRDGVLSPSRAESELKSVLSECGVAPLPQLRLLHLAASAAASVAVSSRNELYPVGLAPERAVKLCAGVFVGGEEFTPDEIRERVRARYPRAAELPGHPELGKLLASAGLNFTWDPARRDSDGAYVNADVEAARLTRSTVATSYQTTGTLAPSEPHDIRQFRESLDARIVTGGFLALTVQPSRAAVTERWLTREYALTVVNLDELFVRTLREAATARRIDWSVVLEADADTEADWQRLQRLVRNDVVPPVLAALTAHRGNVLITNPGLLARYADGDAMRIIAELQQNSGGADAPHTVWLLVPGDTRHAAPMIGRTLVPTINPAEHAVVPNLAAEETGPV